MNLPNSTDNTSPEDVVSDDHIVEHISQPPLPETHPVEPVSEDEEKVEQIIIDRPSWAIDSPIKETLDVWPLAGTYHLRWGTDDEGTMWVAVENEDDNCRFYQKYDEYLETLNRKKLEQDS